MFIVLGDKQQDRKGKSFLKLGNVYVRNDSIWLFGCLIDLLIDWWVELFVEIVV